MSIIGSKKKDSPQLIQLIDRNETIFFLLRIK